MSLFRSLIVLLFLVFIVSNLEKYGDDIKEGRIIYITTGCTTYGRQVYCENSDNKVNE